MFSKALLLKGWGLYKKIESFWPCYQGLPTRVKALQFLGGNRVRIGQKVYQYWNSREIEGTIKTLTIKRSPLGELFMMIVVVDNINESNIKFETSRIAGFDFGLKTFLTISVSLASPLAIGTQIESPEFLKQSLKNIKQASRQHSRKFKGSANREKARKNLVRKYEDVSNHRTDWFWKLAHHLTDKFDVLCFETLSLKGMQRLWGRKISDLALGEFLQILAWVAEKKGKLIVFTSNSHFRVYVLKIGIKNAFLSKLLNEIVRLSASLDRSVFL